MLNNVKVIKAGACTTVQDLGRIGYQKFGIPVAGVMDEFSASVANYLVGNKREEAVLEVTYLGPSLEFQEEMVIAITGAALSPKLNDMGIANWESLRVQKGDVLSFGGVKSGVRAYIAFAGSIDVPVINGSKSTLMKSKIGGFQGRMLQNGDFLSIQVRQEEKLKRVDERYLPKYEHHNRIHVCLGPQDDYFTEKGIANFFQKPYTITANADRMGIRLEGESIEHKEKADIISDAAMIGSIQVPADGKPIILMADRQTTGGYTKIGTVIKEDIVKLAQMGPNHTIQFEEITMEKAQQKYRDFYKNLKELQLNLQEVIIEDEDTSAVIDSILPMLIEGEESMRKFKVSIDGRVHMVEVEEIGGSPVSSKASADIITNPMDSKIAKEKVTVPITGTLTKIAVKEGDVVKEGDLLFIFEAMKMENEALSSCNGVVGIIHKKLGDVVDADEIVLEIF